jgi:membrane protease YdiL (CAAX protease family)
LTAFFAWFFTIGQAWAFAPLLLDRAGIDPVVPPQVFILASTLTGLLLPALVVTRVVDGRSAAARLWRQAFAVRASWRWYLLALLGVPGLALAITVAALGPPEDTPPSVWVSALLGGLVLQLVLTLLPNNLWEEVAWSGFVQARLQRRHGALLAAAITGVLFALQHVSLVVGNAPADAVVVMAVFIVVIIPFRFLTGWVYNATQSLFLVGLVHGSGNAAAGGSGFGAGLLPRLYPDSTLAATAHLLAFFVVGLAAVVTTHGGLGSRSATARSNTARSTTARLTTDPVPAPSGHS